MPRGTSSRSPSEVPPLDSPGTPAASGGGDGGNRDGLIRDRGYSEGDADNSDSSRHGLAEAVARAAGVAAGGEEGRGRSSGGGDLEDAAGSAREGLSDSFCSSDGEWERGIYQERTEVRKGQRAFFFLQDGCCKTRVSIRLFVRFFLCMAFFSV